jgi:16S rRNA (cytidine1402-2'-O)-methyltransferase
MKQINDSDQLINITSGCLYIIATPIGNLEDITLRALRILQEVDSVVCEDTRVTKKLLDYYDIDAQLYSWHANSSKIGLHKIIDSLKAGKAIAYVSDAGTPGISDPGPVLVQQVNQGLPQVKIEAIPGPSALTTAISIAGVPLPRFKWLGFLPHKKGRQTLLSEAANSDTPTIFFESPHRIMKTLTWLNDHKPYVDIILARELTKIYEEVLRGKPSEIMQILESNPKKQKGEFVVIIL